MAVNITVSQTRTLTAENTYVVTSTATAATGMPREIFVFTYAGVYDHVASVLDMQTFPTTPTLGLAFYRANTVTQTFTDVTKAAAAASNHRTQAQRLVSDYVLVSVNFVGSESATYTAG